MIKWFVNKAVNIASYCQSIEYLRLYKIWNEKRQIFIQREQSKWIFSTIFTHRIDIVCVNFPLKYKEQASILIVPKKEQLDLLHFCLDNAETLIYANTTSERRGRRRKSKDFCLLFHQVQELQVLFTLPLFNKTKRKHIGEVAPLKEMRVDGFFMISNEE